jgi:hypothetical protein
MFVWRFTSLNVASLLGDYLVHQSIIMLQYYGKWGTLLVAHLVEALL